MRRVAATGLVAGVCLLGAAFAQAQTTSTTVGAVPAPAFSKPLVLRGTLGDSQIQVNLRPKADVGDGYEGDYFVFGTSPRILLAGDLDGEELVLEESENGTDISGQWEGKRSGDTISGTWQSVDGSMKKPFNIKLLRTDEKSTSSRTSK
jgi:hypothetical protein